MRRNHLCLLGLFAGVRRVGAGMADQAGAVHRAVSAGRRHGRNRAHRAEPPAPRALGQPIVIENRGGAGGVLGTEEAAKAAPDGYTFLFTLSSHTINPLLYKLSFDIERDFAPVTPDRQRAAADRRVPRRSRSNNMQDVVAMAKAAAGQARLRLRRQRHALAHRGRAAQAAHRHRHRPRALQGRRPGGGRHAGRPGAAAHVTMPAAMSHVRAGKLRALAVTTSKRNPGAPEIPTVAEALKIPDYEVDSWYAMFAPAKTPPAIVARMQTGGRAHDRAARREAEAPRAGRRHGRLDARGARQGREERAAQVGRTDPRRHIKME